MTDSFYQNATATLVHHAVHFSKENLTDQDEQTVRNSLIDALASIIGGTFSEGLDQAYIWALNTYQSGSANIILRNISTHPIASAQIHATTGHALDYDDTLDAGGGMHAGTLVHSVGLAVLTDLERKVPWQEYATAIAVGLDIAVRLALATTEDFGWHRTSAFGIFAATIVASRLYQLTEKQTLHALGLAYSQASGNRQCIDDGALSKRFQAGFAARDAITAAQLAKLDITAATRIFEGADGFFNLYQRNKMNIEHIFIDLGKTLWHQKISIKPYPCGRNLHTMLDAVARSKFFGNIHSIDNIKIYVNSAQYSRLTLTYPSQVVEAQFNLAFVIALYLTTQHTDLVYFSQPNLVPDSVKALFKKINIIADNDKSQTIEFNAIDHSSETLHVEHIALGHPNKPLSPIELKKKFLDCYQFALLQDQDDKKIKPIKVDRLLDKILNLQHDEDIKVLFKFI